MRGIIYDKALKIGDRLRCYAIDTALKPFTGIIIDDDNRYVGDIGNKDAFIWLNVL
jgi:hypothetical protein